MPETYTMQGLPKPILNWIEKAAIHRATSMGYPAPEMIDFDFTKVTVLRDPSGEVKRVAFEGLNAVPMAWRKEPATLARPAPFAIFARDDLLETTEFQRLFWSGRIDEVSDHEPTEVNVADPVPRVPVSGLVSLYPDELHFGSLNRPPEGPEDGTKVKFTIGGTTYVGTVTALHGDEEVDVENIEPAAPDGDTSATLPTAVCEVVMPCTSCGVQVSEGESLGDADTEWLCEDCFPKSVLHENGFFDDKASCVDCDPHPCICGH